MISPTAPPAPRAPAAAPTAPEVAATLRPALTRTARRRRQEGGADLSPSLSAALATISRRGPLSPSELAAHERVQRPTATRVAARLEELGLVTKTADADDGRVRRLAVSDAGIALLEASRARKDAWLTRGLDRLSPADRLALARAAALLERLLEEDA
jgi:DNA-binding MarR family transcriptional regulator